MDCDATALTCAVLEVAEALRGGPSVFEVVSQVAVPLLLGVGTLLVAVLSFRVGKRSNVLAEEARLVSTRAIAVAEQSNEVARESHRLSEQMREDAIADRLRKERDEFVVVIFEWVDLETDWLVVGETSSKQAATLRELEALVRATSLESPRGTDLVDFIQGKLRDAKTLDPSWPKRLWVNAQVQYAVRQWLRDPADGVFENKLEPEA